MRAWTQESGFSLIEVLITGLIVGLAAIGTALMFGTGLAYIDAQAEDRVALYLVQQKLEQLRSRGFAALVPGSGLTAGCVPVSAFSPTSSTRPGEPCYVEAGPDQPPYAYRTIVGGGTLSYDLRDPSTNSPMTFPRYTRTTVVECVDDTNFLTPITCPTTPTAKRITVTVTPENPKARPVVVQTALTLY